MLEFDPARRILREASGHAFPAAVVEVGRRQGVVWEEEFGRLTFDADAADTRLETVFDLASLTKVIVTTTLAMVAVDDHLVDVSEPVARRLPEWRGNDRTNVTVRDLLEHTSGLTAYLPFFRDYQGRQEFERAICTLPLEYLPRSQSIYSDLGFVLLGFILEDVAKLTLDIQFSSLVAAQGWGAMGFRPNGLRRRCSAPTEVDSWRGRLLVGEVHDENTFALGGVAGHAGAFGTAREVGAFARTILGLFCDDEPLVSSSTFVDFWMRSGVPQSSRALGWDTMLPTSSCGTRMSSAAVGHTGFTGTSLWIDPIHDIYVVLLTNRVHPVGANDAILAVRRAFHDAVMTAAPWF